MYEVDDVINMANSYLVRPVKLNAKRNMGNGVYLTKEYFP